MPADYPHFTTPRLLLRAFSEADIPNLIALAGNYEVAKNTHNIPHPYTEADAQQWLHLTRQGFEQQRAYAFALELRATGKFIGGMGLTLAALRRFGFEKLKVNKIHATHHADNPASGRVMLKNGMVKEDELAQHTRRALPRPVAIPPHQPGIYPTVRVCWLRCSLGGWCPI